MEESKIVEIVRSIVFMLPVAMLIWHMSKLHSRVDRNKVDIDGLGKKIRETLEADSSMIKSVNERLAQVEKGLIVLSTGSDYMKKEIVETKELMKELSKR